MSPARERCWRTGRDNNYTIVLSQRRLFFTGPFFWNTWNNQAVYYVTIQTADGQTGSGWVRLGGWWRGLYSDDWEVRWDER